MESHEFRLGGVAVKATPAEMKEIADAWWEHYGKDTMKESAEKTMHKAARHIARAFGYDEVPKSEAEIKGAIAASLAGCRREIAGEVIFEAMEWANAYYTLRQIGEDNA